MMERELLAKTKIRNMAGLAAGPLEAHTQSPLNSTAQEDQAQLGPGTPLAPSSYAEQWLPVCKVAGGMEESGACGRKDGAAVNLSSIPRTPIRWPTTDR